MKFPKYEKEKEVPVYIPIVAVVIILCIVFSVFYFQYQASNEKNSKEAFAVAMDSMKSGDGLAAIVKLDEAIKYKEDPVYYFTKFVVLNAMGKQHEAGLNIEKAIELKINDPYCYFIAGQFFAQQEGGKLKALDYLKKSVTMEPKNSEYKEFYASALYGAGKVKESEAVLKDLIAMDPDFINGWNILSGIYMESGESDKAIALRKQAVKKFPENAVCMYLLGMTYLQTNQKAKALNAFKKAIKLDPDNALPSAEAIAYLTGSAVADKYRQIIKEALPFIQNNTHILVKAFIDGHEGTFLVDTGASDSFLTRKFIDLCGIKPGKEAPEMIYKTGAGNMSVPVIYKTIKLGKLRVDNVRIGILPEGSEVNFDGVIGMNVWQNFNVNVDNTHNILEITRK